MQVVCQGNEKNVLRKLSQLVPHHILRNQDIFIGISVVDLEDHSDEIGEDGAAPCLRFDGGRLLPDGT